MRPFLFSLMIAREAARKYSMKLGAR